MDKPSINLNGKNVPELFGVTEERGKELRTSATEAIKKVKETNGHYTTTDIIGILHSQANTIEEFGLCMFYAGVDQAHLNRKAHIDVLNVLFNS